MREKQRIENALIHLKARRNGISETYRALTKSRRELIAAIQILATKGTAPCHEHATQNDATTDAAHTSK